MVGDKQCFLDGRRLFCDLLDVLFKCEAGGPHTLVRLDKSKVADMRGWSQG